MKRNVLNNYLEGQLRSLENELHAFGHNRQPKCLHALRVSIKKTKALLSFAETLFAKTFAKDKLNNLFHKAGEIRELQIILILAKKDLRLPKRFIDSLTQKLVRLEQKYVKSIPRYRQEVQIFHEKIHMPAKLPSKKAVCNYFNKQREKADKKLQSKKRKSLHSYRRTIKRMLYVYGALPEKLQKKIWVDKKKTDKLQERIGRWHDTWSAIAFLSRQNFSKQIRKTLLKLKEKEKKQFKALLIQ